jgi:hypothetical protein
MLSIVFAPQVRLGAPRLDARLADGEDPLSSPALALRGARLASRRVRRQLARGIEHALRWRERDGALSASVPVDVEAVEIARPALQQLAAALRSRERVAVQGLALTRLLVTEPGSPLFASSYPEELYERAREALLGL